MTKWMPLVLLQMLAPVSISLNFITHPEGNLNMEEKIRKRGYPLEIHQVITEDNYILTIHRVPYGIHPPNSTSSSRSPVLLVHGMGGQPEYFLAIGKRSIVYYLADKGFDVWILNARGTSYSQRHKYLDFKSDIKYWKFSFHEIGVYDIPANIDYIVNKTNQKVFLIGHSQGATCYFVMVTERPEYNDKIKLSISYAPSIILKYIDYPFAVAFSHIVEVFELVYNILGLGVLFPMGASFLVKILCSETTYFMQFCIHILSVIGSHESQLLTKEVASFVFSIPPASVAAMQLFHFMQCVKSGEFKQYDYGEIDNMKKYKTKIPPEYNLTKAVAPVAMFYAENDDITTIKGVRENIKVLPNVIFSYKVPYKYFNHIDFLFAVNASNMVYKRNVQLFKDFDNGKVINDKNGR